MNRIIIFDTTLRDGEQSPGASLNTKEKVRIALQLEKLGVDIIEAGFPIASEDDFNAVCQIAERVTKSAVCGLARARDEDIDRAYEAVKDAARPRIHTFIATSPLHLMYGMKKSQEEIIEMTRRAVSRARGRVEDVEFSAMDASRTDIDYLCKVVEAAIAEGAATINIPDTVGYAVPSAWRAFIGEINARIPRFSKDIVLSVHCHDDLGLASANALAAIEAGASQIECTINGIGERGGNTALEEAVMALKVRREHFKKYTSIETREIYATSQLVSRLTGMAVQRNKAIVGENAFAHESGIHQDGVLKKRETFEIMSAEDVGWPFSRFVLGKHSGRHAIGARLETLGVRLSKIQMERFYVEFKKTADKKKEITDEDLHELARKIDRITSVL
ncbi:MAG: 2-isopropylmalate synthase [Candidatus Jacksonbacteria bacterium]|nr:2-isopropylmalate synthase [Candidatus Jacksonbacteria bacterium]